jgi:hypothetical protein
MTRFWFSAWALTALFLSGAAVHCPDTHAELPRKQLREIESDLLPAYEQGETLAFIKSLDRLMRRMSTDQVAEFDLMLQQKQIPKSTHLMVQARMAIAEQSPNLVRKLPKPSWQELALTVKESELQIGEIKNRVTEHQKLLENSVKEGTFEQFESLIWEAHVLEQKLDSAIRLAKYLNAMVEGKQYLRKGELNAEQQAILNRDFEAESQQLSKTLANVRERDLMARIRRVLFSQDVLETSGDLKDRYLAAWSIDFDAPLVVEELQQAFGDEHFHSEFLNDDQLLPQLQGTIQTAMTDAGELLLTKSRHLFTGLHWWNRGRYGMGPDGFGLLKDARAVTSDAALFPLFMPEEMPDAEPPQQDGYGGVPEYDRRHQFIWAWEYRTVRQSASRKTTNNSTSSSSTQITSETQLSRFY